MVTNVRFIERDYYKNVMAENGEQLTEQQIEKILDASEPFWADLTFKFFENGSMIIIDNHTELQVPLSSLSGAACEFYAQQRIKMIKAKLRNQKITEAS
ncbi:MULTISPECIES: hypothetical protein [Paenibacillus]|uniref:Uncharacterized protein n=1 Tax=Paenibacillus oleatilyticus TaxID=2594886 RepID=A0ABV4UT81_9BACL|nr:MULTISPECIES: hypothetical protein [Paenibacillus]MBU7317502.1 hypothetical protein [Paenibacillus oleatilyticus]MCP1305697.1 hypothetical protein [Paenibacillus tyrfis]